ncbi:MAG: hypothetical protein ACI81P_003328 [Neolewinella sp.]|jgi:hypothetical protein
MKYLIALLLCLYLAPATAQKVPQDAISTYFSEYIDNEDFTIVYISGKIFQLVKDAKLDLEDMDEKEVEAVLQVVKDIQGIRILHTDENVKSHWEAAKKRIPTDKYELLFKVRTKDGDNVEAFIQDENAVISELFLLIGAVDNFAMFSFVGNIDLTKLSDLQRAIEGRD